jgi:hypothetical protein
MKCAGDDQNSNPMDGEHGCHESHDDEELNIVTNIQLNLLQ